ncbi:MAG: AIR synthase-related protein, partial [Dehalococcoidia bacterium]
AAGGAAATCPDVVAMHDPTEGGLSGALYEMASGAGLGIAIEAAAVVVAPETEAVCAGLGLDPWGLLASGSLLVAARPSVTSELESAVGPLLAPARKIGVFEDGSGVTLIGDGGGAVPVFIRDELARFLERRTQR